MEIARTRIILPRRFVRYVLMSQGGNIVPTPPDALPELRRVDPNGTMVSFEQPIVTASKGAGQQSAHLKGNSMAKIESVEPRTMHIPLRHATAFARRQVTARDDSLVRSRTDDGLEGIGHCYAGHSGGNIATAAIREMLTPMLIGTDPTSMELLWKNMYQEMLRHGRVGSVMRALSILDLAPWDRNARAASLPGLYPPNAENKTPHETFRSGQGNAME
jgi:hypothetical protein